ncbi:hypothetical protein CAPTEDRAFT_197700 [Capitella teleta]|uniref:G-protein coupled receptors family 1 profile domain-containing protein n=1 Tax=Capitella teleta TaxID=283909 RepID=R7VGU0_CAPTE|nr:hypothetical protein CAPTEDRAFT_197700 [Capitella teleta]|eukprot:ELU18058.1 hypothetical protein CAPTEDRAFT_197700 [Capitella teleta]
MATLSHEEFASIMFNQSLFNYSDILIFDNSSSTVERTLSSATLASEAAFKYGIFVITFFGTVGNLLSIAVFSRKCFRTTTTSIFVRVLAVFDTLTLWSYSLWDVSMYFHSDINSELLCKLLNWIMASAPHVASYTLLTVTLERLTAVIRPLRVHLLFTRRRAIVCSALTTSVPALYNSVYFYIFTQLPNGECGVVTDLRREFLTVWSYFDPIIGIIVPAILIFILNITTIFAFRRSMRMRKAHVIKQFSNYKHETKNLVNGNHTEANKKLKIPTTKRNLLRDQSGHHLTVMLILVSLFYWILMLPSGALFIAKIYWPNEASADFKERMTRFYHVAYLLMLSNSSLDFVLYAVTARKFRRELSRVLLGCSTRQRGIELTTTSNSYY